MGRVDFDYDDGGSGESEVAGTPEGDGDFETDNLPDTGATSAGGQVATTAVKSAEPEPAGLLEKVIDEISHGTLLP